MTQKTATLPVGTKLVAAVMADHPDASEILVSFPDEWELVQSFQRGDTPLYVAGMPVSRERARSDKFFGLPAEINHTLTTYRLYKLFEPWPQPVIPVAWDETRGEGRVLPGGRLQIHLRPVGQAQIWRGDRIGLIWECYLHQSRRTDNRQDELTRFWLALEGDLAVAKIFTQPHEPEFPAGYPEFLAGLGYAPDPEFERWWSKART